MQSAGELQPERCCVRLWEQVEAEVLYQTRRRYHRGLRCFDCHEVHSSKNPSNLKAVGNALCLGCHTKENPAGLKGTVSEHTHHAEGSKGSHCVACHMPLIEQTVKGNYVGSHTFRFITPVLTEQSGVPNPCTSCHQDKDNAWAAKELKNWGTVSPWRMADLRCRWAGLRAREHR